LPSGVEITGQHHRSNADTRKAIGVGLASTWT
jgi:hypothetical protein